MSAQGDSETESVTLQFLERLGRGSVRLIEEMGYGATLMLESLFWLFLGPRYKQPVRVGAVFAEMMEVGVRALPIVIILAGTIGVMLAIQGIYTLRIFGAEAHVTFGIAISVVREFAALITGILVAGRSGSALAARIGTMKINQEIDALRVMGINPVRYLVVPALVAMLIMVPSLTFLADIAGLLAAGIYVSFELGISLTAYAQEVIQFLTVNDLLHGIGKSVIFAIQITLIGVANGVWVAGGAEGVGRATTRSVVQAISAIVVTDMLFVFLTTQ